jgi:hypothetical protein
MKSAQVALVFPDSSLWDDVVFSPGRTTDTAGGLRRWGLLSSTLNALDIEIHTHDKFVSTRDADALVVIDPTRSLMLDLIKQRVNPRRIIFMATEPAVIRRWMWRYLRLYSPFMGQVFVSDRSRARGQRIKWLPLPQPLDGHNLGELEHFTSVPKQKFMVMLRANKISDQPGQLYDERRDLVRYFESREDDLFDLHGPGWNDQGHPAPVMYRNYRGFAKGTVETYAEYKFTLGMDNSAVPGLFTYDLFSAMLAGSVPVYLGAPDISDFVPTDAFINVADFPSYDALVERLIEISENGELVEYRKRGAEFLSSADYEPFTMDFFTRSVSEAVLRIVR